MEAASAKRTARGALTLAALGVVFGDIGTSPLYALKETFSPSHGIPLEHATILGGASTVFWLLMIVVTLKYVTLIMRADNRGEGGIMAMIALAQAAVKREPRWRGTLILVGLLGASLFFGDAVITPAVTMLSAIEGLEVGTRAFTPYVVPLSVVMLLALFALQRQGTALIGRFFGPVSMVWFITLAAGGIYGIVREPAILAALNPLHALRFVTGHGLASFLVLGAVVLAFTGAEALYADMGHFGKGPIRIAWFSIVGPALVLNYFGQGALLMARPEAVANPFFNLYPTWALYPVVALATLAGIIASQAVISGAFSLTRQAIQLGFLPRINIVHTSAREVGQIYIPSVNWVLCAAVITVVVEFGSSSNLAGAYGIAVTATMMVDTVLTFFVIRYGWRYPLWLCAFATGFFLLVDATLFSATLAKIADGGWFPLAIGGVVFSIMTTWRRGREVLYEHLNTSSIPLLGFIEMLFKDAPHRIPGTAIFLTATPDATPHALLHNLNHNKVLHERVVFLTVETRDVPWVSFTDRVTVESLGHGCWRVRFRYGFMNRPDVSRGLELCGALGLEFDMMETSFFLSRQLIVPQEGGIAPMARWRERMFAAMARNAGNITDYFNIPPNRVIELGTRVHI